MKASIVCFGDNCVDIYDHPRKRLFVGGNAVNTAVHAAQGGCPTAYVGSVGRDYNGEAIVKKLNEKNIDTSFVQSFDCQTAWTKVSLIDGERLFAEEYLGPVDRFVYSPEVYAYLFSHTLIHTTWQGGTEHMLKTFRENGSSLVSLDFGERYSKEFLDNNIGNVDIAFFSMSPEDAGRAECFAKDMSERGPRIVVVTYGKNGSLVYDKKSGIFKMPAKLIEAVDTLGAGDTYIGSFIAALVQGAQIPECMKAATEAAAANCGIFGGFANSEITISE